MGQRDSEWGWLFDLERRHGDLQSRRESVIVELCRRVAADTWLWVYSGVEPGEFYPINIDHQSTIERLPPSARAAYVRRALGSRKVRPPRENVPLLELELAQFQGTVQLRELIPDFAAADGRSSTADDRASERAYVEAFGYEASLFSFWPVARLKKARLFCGLHAAREKGKPPFAKSDLDFVTATFERSVTLRMVPNIDKLYLAYRLLTPGQRVVLSLWCYYRRTKDVATALRLSDATVRTQIKKGGLRMQNGDSTVNWSQPLRKLQQILGWRKAPESD